MPDIIVIGDINVDVSFTIPAYPMPGNEAIATGVQMTTGGSAVNAAIALAGMDMDVGFIGRVGQDTLADKVLADLKAKSIDCTYIQTDPTVSTGLIFISVTADGERTMFSARGANAFTDAGAITPACFDQCRWVHLSGYSFLSHHQYETVMVALDQAENSPFTRVSLDVGIEPALRARAQIIEVLPRLDIIFPNQMELTLLGQGKSIEQSLDFLFEHGAKAVVTKCGSEGCILAVDHRRIQIPAFDVEVKDTTGAGDSFNAGVVLGRLIGLSWEAAAVLGNALGALAATRQGSGADSINRYAVAKLVEKSMFHPKWAWVQSGLEELMIYFEADEGMIMT
ncbi:MAG: carbohydrate kinase family protein [Anaerolineae bacterium]|nr:carbohydrate kinase family protein [Anaerolineae bacterium]